MVSTGDLPPGIAIDDGAAVHFVDGKPARVVSGKEKATAYTVALTSEGAVTRMIQDVEIISLA